MVEAYLAKPGIRYKALLDQDGKHAWCMMGGKKKALFIHARGVTWCETETLTTPEKVSALLRNRRNVLNQKEHVPVKGGHGEGTGQEGGALATGALGAGVGLGGALASGDEAGGVNGGADRAACVAAAPLAVVPHKAPAARPVPAEAAAVEAAVPQRSPAEAAAEAAARAARANAAAEAARAEAVAAEAAAVAAAEAAAAEAVAAEAAAEAPVAEAALPEATAAARRAAAPGQGDARVDAARQAAQPQLPAAEASAEEARRSEMRLTLAAAAERRASGLGHPMDEGRRTAEAARVEAAEPAPAVASTTEASAEALAEPPAAAIVEAPAVRRAAAAATGRLPLEYEQQQRLQVARKRKEAAERVNLPESVSEEGWSPEPGSEEEAAWQDYERALIAWAEEELAVAAEQMMKVERVEMARLKMSLEEAKERAAEPGWEGAAWAALVQAQEQRLEAANVELEEAKAQLEEESKREDAAEDESACEEEWDDAIYVVKEMCMEVARAKLALALAEREEVAWQREEAERVGKQVDREASERARERVDRVKDEVLALHLPLDDREELLAYENEQRSAIEQRTRQEKGELFKSAEDWIGLARFTLLRIGESSSTEPQHPPAKRPKLRRDHATSLVEECLEKPPGRGTGLTQRDAEATVRRVRRDRVGKQVYDLLVDFLADGRARGPRGAATRARAAVQASCAEDALPEDVDDAANEAAAAENAVAAVVRHGGAPCIYRCREGAMQHPMTKAEIEDLKGNYRVEVKELAADEQCGFCYDILKEKDEREHVSLRCGHIFCRGCWAKHVRTFPARRVGLE